MSNEEMELKGACKAWEFAKEISSMPYNEFNECFGDIYLHHVFSMNYLDAVKKHETWKANKEAFHVGDEVKFKTEELFVVTWVGETTGNITVMDKGGFCCTYRKENFTKTGRTYPQIKDVLEGLKDSEGSVERE